MLMMVVLSIIRYDAHTNYDGCDDDDNGYDAFDGYGYDDNDA